MNDSAKLSVPASSETKGVPIPTRAKEPHVEVLRDGDEIKAIRVSCACGCEVDIECQYDLPRDERQGVDHE